MALLFRPAALWAALDSLPVAATRLGVLFLALKAGSVLYQTAGFLAAYLRPSKLRRYVYPDAQGNPPWALVTGSSDGVGVAFADELATAGLNVVLHGRNPAKLEGVRQRLASRHPGREFRVLVADAAQVCLTPPTGDAVDRLVSAHLGGLHLTVLINNAGGGLTRPTYAALADIPSDRIIGSVMLNAVFPMLLVARVLPRFQQRQTPALVLNVGSLSDSGLPFLSSYAASKAFTMAATGMVRRELDALGYGGHVQILGVPFGAVTGVSHTKTPPSFFVPDGQTMARAALARTGSGRDVIVGYFPHALQSLLMQLIPSWLQERIFKKVMLELRSQEAQFHSAQKKAL